MAAQAPNIFMVTNDNGRNERFLPLFNHLKQQNHCKFVEDRYCIVHSSFIFNGNIPENIVFSSIQSNLNQRGFHFIMYYLCENVK